MRKWKGGEEKAGGINGDGEGNEEVEGKGLRKSLRKVEREGERGRGRVKKGESETADEKHD